MRTRFLSVALTVLVALALPAQAQDVGIKNPEQPTPTTLYFHVINVQDMPINTQIPNDAFTENAGFAPGVVTLKCLDEPTNGVLEGQTSQVFHTNYGYSSPSYVEYDFVDAQGVPRTHPERGISYDAIFDGTEFTLVWYLVTYVSNTDGPQNSAPLPTPNLVVGATMRAGDAISVDDVSYNKGPVIAQGKTAPTTLIPGPAPGSGQALTSSGQPSTEITYDGMNDQGQHVWKVTIKMGLETDRIQRSTGFNVRIDHYMDNPYCTEAMEVDQAYVMPTTVAPYTDAQHRPRMELSIVNPIRLEYLHPQFVGDDLVVHTSMNSAWGNYDVDELAPPENGGILVEIKGPSPATSLEKAAFVQRTHEHYHHQEAVDVTYVWSYKADRAQNGLYTVRVAFENDQHTARAEGTAQFEIGKGTVIGCGGVQEASQKLNDDCAQSVQADGKAKAEESPGLPLLAALAAIGAAAVLLRRRQA